MSQTPELSAVTVQRPRHGALNQELVEQYRTNGFVRIPQILSSDEVARYQQAAFDYAARTASYRKDAILDQRVNVWQHDSVLRELTLHPRVADAAQQLAGVPLRLWHDQLLVKPAGESAATEYHQDQPYWPHGPSAAPLTAWVALVDVPYERGCLSFLPGSHWLAEVVRHELDSEQGLFELVPELRWSPRVTLPLRAGDCTFHHGRTAHHAWPNRTSEDRYAHAVIFIDAGTMYSGARHVVTDALELKPGDVLDGELFPLADEIASR
jgi:ectoine hydroxylase-related dioxygenase (phytanoyl-CoA dioxygenase family)